MTGNKKRAQLFEKYSAQLHNLTRQGLIDLELQFDKTFICPTCLIQFSKDDLDTSKKNFLTLEDAPPKSLGGKANTLSCKCCNNSFGHEIDFHLAEKLNELDIHSFLPNSGSKVTVTHNGIQVQGVVKVDANGVITITHVEKVNNPKTLKKYISETGKDDIADIKFPASRVDFRRFEIALLKTAYFLAFEHYGYPLILSPAFDDVREQIKNPDKEIYPEGFWTRQSFFNQDNSGVHLITSDGFEGFLAIFVLKTKATESGYGVYLPTSKTDYKGVINNLKKLPAGFVFELKSFMKTDYFNDKINQKMCINFLKVRNK
jgi:hypothetical protein